MLKRKRKMKSPDGVPERSVQDKYFDWLDRYWDGRDRGGERAMRSCRMSEGKRAETLQRQFRSRSTRNPSAVSRSKGSQ